MRSVSTSQAANSTYRIWRLIQAVISTKTASTIRPPSSSPELRWNSLMDRSQSSVPHKDALSVAGPTKLARHTAACEAPCSSCSANPALANDSRPLAALRVASPSGARLLRSQQAIVDAWRDGNSTVALRLDASAGTASANQIGCSERRVSKRGTHGCLSSRATACVAFSSPDVSSRTWNRIGWEPPPAYWSSHNTMAAIDARPIAIGTM